MALFLDDLFTSDEYDRFIRRLFAAYYLMSGSSYEFINEQTALSDATIAKISKKLKNPTGGYKEVLIRLYPNKFGTFEERDYAYEKFLKSTS